MIEPDPKASDLKELLEIDIMVRDAGWEADVQNAVSVCRESACSAFAAGVSGPLPAEAALVLADDEFIGQLNKQYRDRDGATNVLSFAATDDDHPLPDGAPVMLGDIIVARETTVREAGEAGISTEHHLRHLVVHGMLHLLGYDHMTDEEAVEMEQLETRILGTMNVADPYSDNVRRSGEPSS